MGLIIELRTPVLLSLQSALRLGQQLSLLLLKLCSEPLIGLLRRGKGVLRLYVVTILC